VSKPAEAHAVSYPMGKAKMKSVMLDYNKLMNSADYEDQVLVTYMIKQKHMKNKWYSKTWLI
jgi:hypothetical protein